MANVKGYRFCVALGLIFVATGGIAKEWYVQPITKLNTEYDDNPQLRFQDVQDAYGIFTNLGAEYGVRSERYNIASTSLLDLYRYWGHKDLNLDRENFSTDFKSNFLLTERHKLGFDLAYRLDTTLTSELQTTGLIQNQIGREVLSLTPNWSYMLTETKTLKAHYKHEDVTYEKSRDDFLRSYTTDSGALSFYEQWTEATQYFISASTLSYNVKNYQNSIDNYSLTMGFEHQYSETLKLNAMLGGRFTEVASSSFNTFGQLHTESALGWLFGFGLNKQFEVADVSFNYSRNVNPTGVGVLIEADTLEGAVEYRLSERLKTKLSGTIIMTGSTSSDKSFNRSYYSIEPKVSWELSRQASIVGGYRYRTQEYDLINNSATSNSVFVYLDYQWDKMAHNGDSQFLTNLVARLQEAPVTAIGQPNQQMKNKEMLLTAFFTRQKGDTVLRHYSTRFRNAMYYHYAKFLERDI